MQSYGNLFLLPNVADKVGNCLIINRACCSDIAKMKCAVMFVLGFL